MKMHPEKELILPVVGIDKEPARLDWVNGLLQRAEAGEQFSIPVYAQREPDNEWDPNAIAVFLGEQKVGYVPKSWHEVLSCKMPQIFTQHTTPASIHSWGRSSTGKIFLEVSVYGE